MQNLQPHEENAFIEDMIESFKFRSNKKSKPTTNEEPKVDAQPEDPVVAMNESVPNLKKKPKKTRTITMKGLTVIQEKQFKSIWNTLRATSAAEEVTFTDLKRVFLTYMKQQVDDDILIEMLNIGNEELFENDEIDHTKLERSINHDTLREVFVKSKLKL